MQKTILMIGLLLTMLISSKSYAVEGTYIKSDFEKVYYTTRCHQSASQKKIFQIGMKALNSVAKKFSNKLFVLGNDENSIIEEMKYATQQRGSFDTFLKYIDNFIAAEQVNNNSSLDITEKAYLPRGYVVFYGGAKNFGAFKSVGASTNLALIIIPQCRTVWSKKTGKIIKETLLSDISNIDFKIVINPAVGVGKKVGASMSQSRFGVGFIFDPNRNLNNSSDFLGAGVAVSRTNVLGNISIAGKYVKAGTIVNTKLGYFPFVMVGKAAGIGAAKISNWGGVSFLDMAAFTNIFIKLTESQISQINKDVTNNFKTSLENLQNEQNEQNNTEPKN